MTGHQVRISRRRVLGILASVAVYIPGTVQGAAMKRFVWHGTALGAPACLVLYHDDRSEAEAAVKSCVAEIRRLEQEFSLYIDDSAINVLNREGHLDAPSLDMIQLLNAARRWGDRTNGFFDVTVQPLWSLYAAYAAHHSSPPPKKAIAEKRALVDYRAPRVDAHRVTLPRGTALTLNGIAQGYITDRVAELLRRHGWRHVIIDLGEIRALDGKPNGLPWRVGVRSELPHVAQEILVTDRAVATSSGLGTTFDSEGRHHHLFNPKSGDSAHAWSNVTIAAPDAETADALSTALYVMPSESGRDLLASLPDCEGWLEDGTGRTTHISERT